MSALLKQLQSALKRLYTRLKAKLKTAALLALTLTVLFLDPFGLATASDEASEGSALRILSPFYSTEGQKDIVVVLIDDQYLKASASYWPIPYVQQAKLFKRLLSYEPKAVFVDLLYSHDHSELSDTDRIAPLANTFARYKQKGISLYIADTGKKTASGAANVNTLPEFTATSQRALVTWSGFDGRYPFYNETELGVLPSAATALYQEVCQAGVNCPEDFTDEKLTELPPLALRWGASVSPQQATLADISGCNEFGRNPLLDAAKEAAGAVFWRFREPVRQPCPYTMTVKASDLLVTTQQDRELLRSILQNKLVLVGAHVHSAADLAPSPVHGLLPGVYVHAMALDNMITLGESYLRDPANLFGEDINLIDLVEVLVVFFLLKLKTTGSSNEPIRFDGNSARGISGSPVKRFMLNSWLIEHYMLVFFSLITLSTLVMYFGFHYTLVNWIGLLLMGLFLLPEMISGWKEKRRKKAKSAPDTIEHNQSLQGLEVSHD